MSEVGARADREQLAGRSRAGTAVRQVDGVPALRRRDAPGGGGRLDWASGLYQAYLGPLSTGLELAR